MRKKIILTLLLTILLFVGFRPNVTAETSDAITEAESAEQNELDRAVLAAAEAERRELNRERVNDEPPEIITADPNRRTRATLTVGTNCTYANLQTAVNASLDGDTILVEGKTFSGSSATVNIGNGQAITIIGGYDDSCTTPTATPTTLNATGQGDSVFELYGSNGSVGNFDQVTIRNFVITGGEDDANFGGGIEINVGYEVRIEDSEIAGNTSTFGGGIHINGDAGLRAGDAKLFISSNTVIKGNTATDSGGGIYCFEADVVLTGDASLGDYFIVPIGNTATNEGGGFYGDGGCRFDAYADVKGNDAANGGGVYLTGSSSLFMLFAESAILNNHATTGDGGGVYLSDGSSITQSIGQIRYNTANDDGGGIYAAGNGTQVTVKANTGTHCVVGEKCVEVSHNTATGGNGGGIYLNGGATADVAQAYFEYNTSQFGGAIYLSRSAALQTALTVSNVVFARNTVENKYILRYYSTDAANVALRLEGITFAENIDNFGNVVEIGLRGNYTANLLGLIIWGADSQDAYFTETGASVTIDFSLLPAGGAFPPTNQVGVDPLFIDPANDDWHLRPDSPAVNVYFGGGLADDVEGETRPARGSSFFVGAMAWDAGADEATSRVSINGELCRYATIGEAVAAASNGDVLYISGGHYFELLDEVGKTLSLSAANIDCTALVDSNVDNVVSLRGSNGSADATGGIVQITGSNTITFTNVALLQAQTGFGGLIYVDGAAKAVFIKSRLSEGSATSAGGCARVLGTLEMIDSSIYDCETTGSGDGAAVALNTGTLIMRGDSQIGTQLADKQNISADDGGGVHGLSSIIQMYDDSSISYNEAESGNGGGVYLDHNSQLTMRDSNAIRGNLAINGAGVYVDGGAQLPRNAELNLSGNAVIGGMDAADRNVASGTGGGAYLTGGAWLKLTSGMIYNNHAGMQGGGVALLDGGWMTMATTNSEVRENSASGDGGGIHLSGLGTNLTMSNGAVMSNTTSASGGGLNMSNAATATLDNNAAIVGNQATGVFSDGGGAMINHPNTLLTLNDQSVVRDNTGVWGGGMRVFGNAEVRMRDSAEIRNNHADRGSGIYLSGNGIASIVGTSPNVQPKIRGNTALTNGGLGGGIYVNQTTHLDMTQAQFVDNEAIVGGGIYANNATADLINVTFVDNSATANGGGIAARSGAIINMSADMTAPTRVGNCDPRTLASGRYCSEFYLNQAQTGSALDIDGSTVDISHTSFSNNHGTVNNVGSTLRFTGLSDVTLDTLLISSSTTQASVVEATGAGNQLILRLSDSTIADNIGWAITTDSDPLLIIKRNIIWDNSKGTKIDNGATLTTVCNIAQTVHAGSQLFDAPDDVNSDPLFVGTARGSYFLAPASPAIDACAGLTPYDLENVGRPKDGNGAGSIIEWDRGAFEYDPNAVPTAVGMRGMGVSAEIIPAYLLLLLLLTSSLTLLYRRSQRNR